MLRRILFGLAVLTLAGAGLALLPVTPASSGGPPSITVDTVEDDATKVACTSADNDCSLRGALEGFAEEQNTALVTDITVPAGEYVLDDQIFMELGNVNVHGAGVGDTIVTMDVTVEGPVDRHLDLDPDNDQVVLAVALSDMTFDGGFRRGDGGSIFTESGVPLTIRRMHFLNNTATSDGGAISVSGTVIDETLVVEDTTFEGNEAGQLGGAVFVTEGETATFTNSTFTDNNALLGGALFVGQPEVIDDAEATLIHTTLSGNTAEAFDGPAAGGAIAVGDGAEVMLNATVIENSTESDGELTPAAEGDTISNCFVIEGGEISSQGHNVVDDDTCNATEDTDKLDSADVQALGDNGGPTFTMALLEDSPAVDAAGASCLVDDDQRGVARPQDGNADGTVACDSGAFELAAEEPPAAQPAQETPDFTG